jgi:hypothetical protein
MYNEKKKAVFQTALKRREYMQAEELKALIEDAVNDTDLRVGDIPSIDLYLDQITSLMSDQISKGSPRFHDRILTKTMVNNYSKDGLLSPLTGKKYSKEQFLQMLLVYAMKNTLSIGEIKQVLQSVYALEEYDKHFLENAYERYLDEKQRMREQANGFSVYTCFPASSARTVTSSCAIGTVRLMIRSIVGSS